MSFAFIFPGQGSQAVGMGKELADAFPAAKAVFDEVDAALGDLKAAARGAAMPASLLGGSAALAGLNLRDFATNAAPGEEQGLGLDLRRPQGGHGAGTVHRPRGRVLPSLPRRRPRRRR